MHMCDLYLGYRFGIWGFTSTFDLLSKFGKQNQSAQKWASSITRTTRARVIFWDFDKLNNETLSSLVLHAHAWSSEMRYFEITSSTMTLLVVTPSKQRHRMPFKPPVLFSAEMLT